MPLNVNRDELLVQLPILENFVNTTSDVLILTKLKLLQVTSHNRSINVHVIRCEILITLTNNSSNMNILLYINMFLNIYL